MEIIHEIICASDAKKSVKELLIARGFSTTLIKKAKRGRITVNGDAATVRRTVEENDVFSVWIEDEKSEDIPPIDIPITVLCEDDDIIAVDKPSGMPTHPSRGNSLPTLANAVMAKFDGNFVFRAITRLDRDTSGILLIAKNQMAAGRLSAAMKAGKFRKKYACTVVGVPSERHGIIDAPIARESEDSIKRVVREDGKRAVTEYSVIETHGEYSVCEVLLHTGRTHQIRVHMAHIGHPLVGDFLYGERNENGYHLRAFELSFPHPTSGEITHIRTGRYGKEDNI